MNSANQQGPEIEYVATTDRGHTIHVLDASVEFPSLGELKEGETTIIIAAYDENTTRENGKFNQAVNKLEKITDTKLTFVF